MQTAPKLILVGIGYRPLSAKARAEVLKAEVLLASTRLLDVFSRYDEFEAVKDRIRVIDKVPETISFMGNELRSAASGRQTIVLLASGDPFFFGIGRRMIDEFGAENIRILPDLSSMQEAFARINVPWDDAFCISVHGGPDIAKRRKLPYEVTDIPQLLERYGKLAILTDRQNNPNVIAKVLRTHPHPNPPLEGEGSILMHVCERLGYPDERIWAGRIEEAAGMTFADPNVTILQLLRPEGGAPAARDMVLGLKEEELSHARGLITKDEVRAVAVHKLRLPRRGVLWDIGAGSGSVSIEAARMTPGLRVIAIERSDEQIGHLKANRSAFDVRNLEITQGTAPDVLAGLAPPDRVFIGGSGGNLAEIVRFVGKTMAAGVIVINAATLETLQAALKALEENGFDAEVSEISVSRSKPIAGKRLMTALNPIYVVTGRRG